MGEPVSRVENLTRVYRSGDVEVQALRGVNLTVLSGEFVAIMGHSGSGKSTLMSILGCLDRPTGGHYFFEGLNVAQLSEPDLARIRSERLGFVFQSFNLLPRTSALENVTLPLFYSAVAPSGREVRIARARAALALLGLEQREHNTSGQLSGGQQQRVAIARALINTPSLILADEPTGNLDTKTSHEIMETLVSLNRDQGVTIVVVTHEPDIAAYAKRVITMRDGQIISDEKNPENESRITGYVNQIYVQATTSAEVQNAIDQLTAILMRRHRILPGQTGDFAVRNLSQIAEAAEGSSRIMALLLAAVASISLLVGGIGIMNILLVSVTERTREIGLRMAIGARRLHVLLQFLTEAVFLSVSGGIAGIVLGIAFALVIPHIAGWPAPVSLWAVAGGFFFSAAVGVFFGYYPARKAASLDPIEALRYE